jgi:hypothetical protein
MTKLRQMEKSLPMPSARCAPQPARGKARCQADTRATAHYRDICAAPHCRGTHDATH